MADLTLGLSFDDVLLVPRKSEVLPTEARLDTALTKSISLKIPVVSAAMDTVSESDLAIALAREGGLSVIHRACSVEQEAAMVALEATEAMVGAKAEERGMEETAGSMR